ncbi:hypothetical protein GCM10007939_18780 [Amylibacter marinus]|uniref:Uncharacterized protein n=1 Tax=Amylibacter marinus TaxID=1475483 RepID=A0ABQ5VW69_9RHOB|nr:hypothetical protein [Amylibacter marinus]GLQ35595.1 hypothetical protein GCM10007939_18780 [Amylibacter marinus]
MSAKNAITPSQKRDENRRNARKKSEISIGMTIAGVILWVTPMVNIFTTEGANPSIFALLVYVFGAWAALILGAFFVSRMLISQMADD